MSESIKIYTDGAAKGNPGRGGYGTVLKFAGKEKELSQGFRMTTNNRMELLAVIVGLESLKTNAHAVEIYSDSKYVVDSVEKKWVFGWKQKGFKGKKIKIFGNDTYPCMLNFNLNFIGSKDMLGIQKTKDVINWLFGPLSKKHMKLMRGMKIPKKTIN